MRSNPLLLFLSSVVLLAGTTSAKCYDPTPAFLPPKLDPSDPILRSAFASLGEAIETFAADDGFNATSFSVEVSSVDATLWSHHHTAKELNSSRPGAHPVTDHSFYRIASITKTFTALSLLEQAAAGTLTLDDPVNKYLPELNGAIPWKDITLRTLASQLSGIPRDWSQGDLIGAIGDPLDYGLPSPSNPDLPTCYGYDEQYLPCNSTDLFRCINNANPLFAPGYQSSYSNTNFELLGLVLANVTGKPYEQVIYSLLSPLGITDSGATFEPPADKDTVMPSGIQFYKDVRQGVHNPTGGLFMTTSAMSAYLRHILTHFNSPSTLSLQAGNWLTPHSFTSSMNSFYGMPWEIFRSMVILSPRRERSRAVTFFTKGGGVPGYTTNVALVPEYNLAFSIFTAGNTSLLDHLIENVTTTVVRAAETIAAHQLTSRYTGTYTAPSHLALNSSLSLAYDSTQGLHITSLISNSTATLDVFANHFPALFAPGTRAQLIPTQLYADETNKRGEKWRIILVPRTPSTREERDGKGVWDEFCVTDLDFLTFDGRPLGEVVFWDRDGDDGDGDAGGDWGRERERERERESESESESSGGSVKRVREVELTAFRVKLDRVEEEEEEEEEDGEREAEKVVVQDGGWNQDSVK